MSIPRILFSSSRSCSKNCFNLLHRFGQSKKLQFRNYAQSSSSSGKPRAHSLLHSQPEAQPSSRSWASFLIPTTALAGAVGFAAFVHYNDERRSIPKGQCKNPQDCAVKGPVIGGPFTLIDTERRPVTERDFLGNWVLLYFGYTSSPDIGPERLQTMANATDTLGSKQNTKILPVFVTIDPERDFPSQLRAYLKEFSSKIVGLTGPVSAIRQMAQEYRVFFKKIEEEGGDYLVESSHNMYLINPNMEIMRSFGIEYKAEDLSEAILKEVKRAPQ